MLERDKERER
jgi:hypothetical protein